MASIFFRTAIIYILLTVVLKLMGKRQIGELEISELVSTLLISEIAALPIDDPDIPLLSAVIPILFILSLEIIDSLKARVYQDVEKLIESKKKIPVPSKEVEEERKEKDAEKERSHTTMDGHSVKSDMEVRIDDILYMNRIIHCYEKPIDEIAEKRKKCDWFIPITANKGIYIEYWGMDTPEYKKARAEKEELYRTNNIPYISIEKDEPKNDTQIFSSNLIRDITKLAKERYKFMPEWS